MRGVRFIKEGPDFWLRVLPSGHLATVVLVLKAKLLCNLLVRWLVRLDVQLVEDGQGGLRVPVRRVRHPTARLDLQTKVQIMIMMTAVSVALGSRITILRWDYRPGYCPAPKTQAPPQREVHKHLKFFFIPIVSST